MTGRALWVWGRKAGRISGSGTGTTVKAFVSFPGRESQAGLSRFQGIGPFQEQALLRPPETYPEARVRRRTSAEHGYGRVWAARFTSASSLFSPSRRDTSDAPVYNKETEAPGGEVTCPGSHSQAVAPKSSTLEVASPPLTKRKTALWSRPSHTTPSPV